MSNNKLLKIKVMRKLVLISALIISAFISTVIASTSFVISTSCGVDVIMVYEDNQTALDLINDALILEEYYCG